jgi:hypothetical protein
MVSCKAGGVQVLTRVLGGWSACVDRELFIPLYSNGSTMKCLCVGGGCTGGVKREEGGGKGEG